MNEDIKSAAKEAGVPLFRVGYDMGMSESALSRKLRKPLSDKDREAIYLAIYLAIERVSDYTGNVEQTDYRLYTSSNKVRYMLAKRRMKVKELSERSGINCMTIYNINNCKCATVKYSTAYAICDALQCDISDVFPGKDRRTIK